MLMPDCATTQSHLPVVERVTVRPKLFLDTNVCINVASGKIPCDEWRRVRQHIEANFSYQISFITLKELFAKLSRGKDDYFEENKGPLSVLCGFLQPGFLPYPPVFALRTVLGLPVARRSRLPFPEEQRYEIVLRAVLQCSSKAQLKAGVPCPGRPRGVLSFDLDHFDRHENEAQAEHLRLLQRMRAGGVETSSREELASLLIRDCGQTHDAESCNRLANALEAAYRFSDNLSKESKNNSQANLEKRETDWGDIMQLYYLCDESMRFLTYDKKCRNQVHGCVQQNRILLYGELARLV